MNASFSPEVVGIIRNKILATIEKVLSIKFPFIPDLDIGVLIHSIIFFLISFREKIISQTQGIVQYEIT